MKKRILHTMLRVSNLEESVRFYTKLLDMKVLRYFDNSEGRYTLVFLGYASEPSSAVIELTYNYGVSEYVLGNAYGHIAIGVDDCYRTCDSIRQQGGKIAREPGPLKGGTEVIAFVEDPDGYRIELIERGEEWFDRIT